MSAVHDVFHFALVILPVGVVLVFVVGVFGQPVFEVVVVVVVYHVCIISSSPLFVKPNRKVFYFPQGCRLASPTPIMARGIRIAASIAIVVMSIVCYPLFLVALYVPIILILST